MGTNSPRPAREVVALKMKIARALSERNRVNGGIRRKLTHVYPSEAAAIALDALSTEGWEVHRANPSTGEGTE